jgi:amino acid transporter
MDSNLNKVSLYWGVPGLTLQTFGYMLANVMVDPLSALLFLLVSLAGTALLLVGLAYYAKAKGHSPAWGLVGLLSCLGIVVLAVLPDKLKQDASETFDIDSYDIPDGTQSPFGSKGHNE